MKTFLLYKGIVEIATSIIAGVIFTGETLSTSSRFVFGVLACVLLLIQGLLDMYCSFPD